MKIKAEMISTYPIWGIYLSESESKDTRNRVDHYYRKTKKQQDGLTKKELEEILETKEKKGGDRK